MLHAFAHVLSFASSPSPGRLERLERRVGRHAEQAQRALHRPARTPARRRRRRSTAPAAGSSIITATTRRGSDDRREADERGEVLVRGVAAVLLLVRGAGLAGDPLAHDAARGAVPPGCTAISSIARTARAVCGGHDLLAARRRSRF